VARGLVSTAIQIHVQRVIRCNRSAELVNRFQVEVRHYFGKHDGRCVRPSNTFDRRF
jgi:hypothetical protein